MKREHHVAALEVLLRVGVQRAAHRPPPAVLAVDIPNVVNVRSDSLYGDLLQVDDWIIAHLVLEVGENHLSLARCRFHSPCLLHLIISAVEMLLPYQDDISQNEEGDGPGELFQETAESLVVQLQDAHENYVPLILSVNAAV